MFIKELENNYLTFYRYGFNGQEKDNEISGAGNSYTAEFWQYDSRTGRRWNVDPVNKDWHGSYTTFSNNPIIYVDPNGDVDFYNTKGSKVGTDGVNDGIIMVVTDKKIAREMYKKYKKGHKITAVEMNKMKAVLFQLPSQKVRKAVQAAHIRANTPSENDKKGDSHEEGGAWGIDKEGNEKVIEAVPGEVYVEGSPHVDIDVFKAKNPEDKGTIEDGNYMGTYHIHPRKEKFIKTESFLDGRKITVTKSAGPFFTQYPSTGGLVDDYKPHQQAIDYGILNKDAIGIVVGAYSNIATFYNASRENNVTIPTSLLYNYKETGKSYKEEKKDAKKKN